MLWELEEAGGYLDVCEEVEVSWDGLDPTPLGSRSWDIILSLPLLSWLRPNYCNHPGSFRVASASSLVAGSAALPFCLKTMENKIE